MLGALAGNHVHVRVAAFIVIVCYNQKLSVFYVGLINSWQCTVGFLDSDSFVLKYVVHRLTNIIIICAFLIDTCVC